MNKRRIIIPLLIAIIALFLDFFGTASFHITKVIGNSMENTLMDGDYIAINKLNYKVSKPERFDVIVFPFDEENRVFYVKRVIGLPGETIQIKNSAIYINDQLLPEFYGKESMDENTEGIAIEKINLKENEYFVLGDNRNQSFDSRDKEVGFIKQENILGKAFLRISSFSHITFIRG